MHHMKNILPVSTLAEADFTADVSIVNINSVASRDTGLRFVSVSGVVRIRLGESVRLVVWVLDMALVAGSEVVWCSDVDVLSYCVVGIPADAIDASVEVAGETSLVPSTVLRSSDDVMDSWLSLPKEVIEKSVDSLDCVT